MGSTKRIIAGIIAVFLACSGLITTQNAEAAGGLTSISDSITRLKASTAANHTITFTTTAGIANNTSITVTFASAFDTSTIVEDDVDISGSTFGELTTAADCSSTENASVAMVSDVLTITLCSGKGASFAASEVVTIEVGTNAASSGTGSHQITNPTAGQHQIDLTAGASETGSVAVRIISDDQIVVDASVDPTLAFSISANTASFGSLSAAAVRWATSAGGNTSETAAATLTVGTNAKNGFVVQVKDDGDGSSNAGLYSAGANNLIPTVGPTDVSAGSEEYAVYGGNASNASEFNAVAGFLSNGSTALTRSFQNFSSHSAPTTDNRTLDFYIKASIGTWTEAGSYADTITLICTANF